MLRTQRAPAIIAPCALVIAIVIAALAIPHAQTLAQQLGLDAALGLDSASRRAAALADDDPTYRRSRDLPETTPLAAETGPVMLAIPVRDFDGAGGAAPAHAQ